MYIIFFYSLIFILIFSLYQKFDPNFVFFTKKEVKKEQIMPKKVFSTIELVQKGDFFYEKGFLSLAIGEYSKAFKKNNNILILKKIYKAQILLGEFKKAEKNILNSLSSSYDEKIISDLIYVKIKLSEFDTAKNLLSNINNKSLKIKFSIFLLNLLENLSLNEILENAEAISRESLFEKNNEITVKIGKIKDAILEFKSFRDSDKKHLHLLIAKALSNINEFEISNKIIENVLEKRGDYRDALILLSYNKIRKKEPKIALKYLNKAYKINPSQSNTLFYIGICYEDLKQLSQAETFFNRALKNGYKNKGQIYQKLAKIYFKTKQFDKSFLEYQKLLDIKNIKIEHFLISFDISVENLKSPQMALELANTLFTKYKNNENVLAILGYSNFLNGNLDSGETFLNKSLLKNPKNSRALFYKGLFTEKRGRIVESLKYFEKSYKNDKIGKFGKLSIEKYNLLLNKNEKY